MGYSREGGGAEENYRGSAVACYGGVLGADTGKDMAGGGRGEVTYRRCQEVRCRCGFTRGEGIGGGKRIGDGWVQCGGGDRVGGGERAGEQAGRQGSKDDGGGARSWCLGCRAEEGDRE